jgi:hypothetical protein
MIKSRRMRWAGDVARRAKKRILFKNYMRKPQGRKRLKRQSCRLEDNIKVDLKEIG